LSQSPDSQSLRDVIVLGAGGHGGVVLDMLLSLDRNVICILDEDASRHGQRLLGVEIRGGDALLEAFDPNSVGLALGFGSIGIPHRRANFYNEMTSKGYLFETLIHPTAIVASDVNMGTGCQIMAGVVIQSGVIVGENAIINTAASVDHDCRIGKNVHVAPGVTFSGRVTVGDNSHIGTGAVLIQEVAIGEKCTVGAGAVVLNDIPSGQTVVGNPAVPLLTSGETC
jgi:sugar O-acyltransferase (sialic acid O-acetyltransferase NeuD family)